MDGTGWRVCQLLSHVGAPINGYRTGELDAYAANETIHNYHQATAELWMFCFPTAEAPTPSSSPISLTA